MIGGSHAATEPYTLHFMTTVEHVEDRQVVLEETYFYPKGAGQPADRGSIDGVSLTDVRIEDGQIVHELDREPSYRAGEFVSGSIDEIFRTYCMRAHTASHVLYGAGRRLLEDVSYGGFDISPERITLDFETSSRIDDEALVELERLANTVVWEDREVDWWLASREDALSRADLSYDPRREEAIGYDDQVRIVEIDGWDVAACAGTHVNSTGEVGPITVLGATDRGDGVRRVTFAVGPAGIRHHARDRQAALDAARSLGTTVVELPEAVSDLLAE